MALPAHLIDRLPTGVRPGSAWDLPRPASLPLGIFGIDSALPDGGLPRGAVVDLCVSGGSALGRRIALAACRAAQREDLQGVPWCAYLDPSASLYAPGVAQAEVSLARLLVVQPAPADLSRVAIRVAESRACVVIVVDAADPIGPWDRVVRRIALAVEGTQALVLILTTAPIRLPVSLRIDLCRIGEAELSIRVAKDRYGRISPARTLAIRP